MKTNTTVDDIVNQAVADFFGGSVTASERIHENVIANLAGLDVIDAVSRFAKNEMGQSIRMTPWLKESLQILTQENLSLVITSGAQQVSKTTSNILAACYWFIHRGYPLLYSWERDLKKNAQLKTQFYPIYNYWSDAVNLGQPEAQNTTLLKVGSRQMRFIFAAVQDSGGTAVSSQASSFAVEAGFLDEFSQYPPDFFDIVKKRLTSATNQLKAEPLRLNGTAGFGSGTDYMVRKAKYWFYPHFKCSNCGEVEPLDPIGCLLKPKIEKTKYGEETRYFTGVGRPLDWWCKSDRTEKEREDTAFFACPYCGHEITPEQRDNSWLQCRHTGIKVDQFQELTKTEEIVSDSIGLTMSPLLRVKTSQDAARIIIQGNSAKNIEDWHQQTLGIESTSVAFGISLEDIRLAIDAPVPKIQANVCTMGVDMGTSSHFMALCDWYVPEWWNDPIHSSYLNFVQIVEETICQIHFLQPVTQADLPRYFTDADFGLIDVDPFREATYRLCMESGNLANKIWLASEQRYKMQPGDQRPGCSDEYRVGVVQYGSETVETWLLNNDLFLTQVKNLFVNRCLDKYPNARLPKSFERYVGSDNPMSPLKHLQAPYFDPNTQKWARPKDHNDDLYYALAFARAAFGIWLQSKIKENRSGMSVQIAEHLY